MFVYYAITHHKAELTQIIFDWVIQEPESQLISPQQRREIKQWMEICFPLIFDPSLQVFVDVYVLSARR
jgi:hypothetical protein